MTHSVIDVFQRIWRQLTYKSTLICKFIPLRKRTFMHSNKFSSLREFTLKYKGKLKYISSRVLCMAAQVFTRASWRSTRTALLSLWSPTGDTTVELGHYDYGHMMPSNPRHLWYTGVRSVHGNQDRRELARTLDSDLCVQRVLMQPGNAGLSPVIVNCHLTRTLMTGSNIWWKRSILKELSIDYQPTASTYMIVVTY